MNAYAIREIRRWLDSLETSYTQRYQKESPHMLDWNKPIETCSGLKCELIKVLNAQTTNTHIVMFTTHDGNEGIYAVSSDGNTGQTTLIRNVPERPREVLINFDSLGVVTGVYGRTVDSIRRLSTGSEQLAKAHASACARTTVRFREVKE